MNVTALRGTVLDRAAAEAFAIAGDAEERAAGALQRARSASEELVARAQAEGTEVGELELARTVALARRRARRLVLEARRGLYDEFRREAAARVLALRDDPGYPQLLDRLADAARAALGPDAVVELDPEGAGGVRARAGRRSVDLTLGALADRCIEALGDRVEELWR